MKKILLVIILFPLFTGLFGQVNTTKSTSRYFQMGLNSTNMIKNLLSFNSNDLADPYSLVGSLLKNGKGMRFGLGLDIGIKKNPNTFLADNSHSKIDVRVGIQNSKSLIKNLYLIYGFDALGEYEKDYSVLQNFTNIDNTWSLGAGPMMGVLYVINEHLSISTESNIYFRYSNKTSILKQNGIVEEDIRSEGYRLTHILPNSLYIFITI